MSLVISVEWSEPIKNYVKEHLPKVRHYTTPERAGLIRARIFGANIAKAEVGVKCYELFILARSIVQ